MGVTVKKCHIIMSGNDCWNSVCFSCCRKAGNELADVKVVTADGRHEPYTCVSLAYMCGDNP